MKKLHGSLGSVPKPKKMGDPLKGKPTKGCGFGDAVVPQSAPNNPDKPCSGKPKKYEGGEAKLQGNYSPSKQNYAQEPKHLKQ